MMSEVLVLILMISDGPVKTGTYDLICIEDVLQSPSGVYSEQF
jgi:hypothetical protein